MYLNIGNDIVLDSDDIICIMDTDNTTQTLSGGKFLIDAEKKGVIVDASGNSFPRTFIVARDKEKGEIVYLSNVNSSTIVKSIKKERFFE